MVQIIHSRPVFVRGRFLTDSFVILPFTIPLDRDDVSLVLTITISLRRVGSNCGRDRRRCSTGNSSATLLLLLRRRRRRRLVMHAAVRVTSVWRRQAIVDNRLDLRRRTDSPGSTLVWRQGDAAAAVGRWLRRHMLNLYLVVVRVQDAVRRWLLGNGLLDHLRLRGWLCLQRWRCGVSGLRGVVGELGRWGQPSSNRRMPARFLRLAPDVIGTHVALRRQLSRFRRTVGPLRWLLGNLWKRGRRMGPCRWDLLGSLRAPLGTRWAIDAGSLVGLRMYVLRRWCGRLMLHTVVLAVAQQ